ncbi:hypothetical protein Tco_1236233 [Tanacetum coccineum]
MKTLLLDQAEGQRRERQANMQNQPQVRKRKIQRFGSSKGTKYQLKSFGNSVQLEEPVNETASRHDWFKKPTPRQEPTDPDWNISKTTQEGPTQSWLMTLAASTSTDKSLLKGTRSNYAELEYDFEECYKALSEKLNWENPEGGDYPFDLSKPLPLITHGKRQRVPFEYFINNDLKYLQGGVSTMIYTTSTTKTKAAQYDLPGIEDMVSNIWSPVKVAYDRYALWDFFLRIEALPRNIDMRVSCEEKMEYIGKEKSSFHDQGHQQAAKGKEDDKEFGEICWRFNTTAGNPVKKILLKLNLSDHSEMPVQRELLKHRDYEVDLDCCLGKTQIASLNLVALSHL